MEIGLFVGVVVALGVILPIVLVVKMMGRARGPGWAKDPSALSGHGTLTGVRDTGTTMNEAAQFEFSMEVTLPGEAPYPAKTKMLVSRANFGVLQPGMTVAVKVKPDDRDKVWIDLTQPVAPAGAPMGGAGGYQFTGSPDPDKLGSAAELLASGAPGQATIKVAQPLGMTAAETGGPYAPGTGDDPLYLFEVDVALDGGAAPFPARFGHRVPKDRIATLAVGSRLRVAVDPSKPSEAVAIDWDRS